MKRHVGVLAFALAVLVVTAPIALAATNTAVVSVHTTGADFNAGTLTNMSVEGSGSDANVVLGDVGGTVDDFEDQSLTEYQNDTGAFSINSDPPVYEGTYSLKENTAGNQVIVSKSGLNDYLGVGQSMLGNVSSNQSDHSVRILYFVQDTDNYYMAEVNIRDDELSIFDVTGGTFDEIAQAPVTLSPNVEYRTNITVTTGNDHIFTVINGSTGAQVGSINAVDSTSTLSGGIGFRQGIGGSSNPGSVWDNFRLEGTEIATPGTYISQNHTAENTQQGFLNVTELTNATMTATWETSSGTGWETLNQTAGITSPANHTFTWSAESNSTVRVNVTVENETANGVPSFTLADEGVQFENVAPTVDNGSATPSGGTEVTSSSVTLSIPVNDSDFDLLQSDKVEVEFFVNGSSVGTDTLTSNGTATAAYSVTKGGTRQWHAVARDSYGGEQRSANFLFNAPSQISIRQEAPPHDLIKTATVTINIYEEVDESPEIIQRTTTDGNVSLSGVPVDSTLVATVEAPGYYNRTVIIKDVFDQQNVFLLNKSTSAITAKFVIIDVSGKYTPASETSLEVKKAINRSEYGGNPANFTWTTIAGDTLGADESFTTTLEEEKRYRLVVENTQTGSRAILGAYEAKQTETVELTVGELAINLTDSEDVVGWNATDDDTNLYAGFEDPEGETTTLKIRAHERFNESNVLFSNQTFTDVSSVIYTEPYSGDQNETTWVVEFYWQRGGEWYTSSEIVGSGARDLVPANLDVVWKTSVGVFVLLTSALIFTQLNVAVGAVVTSLIGGMLWYIGLLGGITTGPAVVLAFAASLAYSWMVEVGR